MKPTVDLLRVEGLYSRETRFLSGDIFARLIFANLENLWKKRSKIKGQRMRIIKFL